MKTLLTCLLMTSGAAGAVFGVSACDGQFAGPPQGSVFAATGKDPIIGAVAFSYYPEMPATTGFANDYWFLNPGIDSNDVFWPPFVAKGDGIDALMMSRFEAFVNLAGVGSPLTVPTELEVNTMYPMCLSFIAQWFARKADGSRPLALDEAGNWAFSAAAHDISIISAPMEASLTVNTGLYPAGGNLPLFGYTSPPATDPASFPKPTQPYTNNQFSQLGVVRYSDVAAPGAAAIAPLGGPITDDLDNSNVENMGAIPVYDQQSGQITAPLNQPTGVFADIFALSYNAAPLEKPTDPDVNMTVNGQKIQSINDPDLEEALIEFSRHFAAVHTNLIGQAVGVSTRPDGTVMSTQMVQMENRYEYRFHSDDHHSMSTRIVGMPDPVDQRVNVGQLPGKDRRAN